jgi:hypothetical protein
VDDIGLEVFHAFFHLPVQAPKHRIVKKPAVQLKRQRTASQFEMAHRSRDSSFCFGAAPHTKERPLMPLRKIRQLAVRKRNAVNLVERIGKKANARTTAHSDPR